MWQHEFEQKTDLAVEAIWPILANVSAWADVDQNIEKIGITEKPAAGVRFALKPKGGPTLSFTIGDFAPPTTYSDICKMPLATMTTLHTLAPGAQTTMRVKITIDGPLAWFWGLVVGRKHASGLPAQTERILAAARQRLSANIRGA